MSTKFYFNTKYDTYQTRANGMNMLKISAVLNDGNGPMFAVLNIKDTGKTQVQSFSDASNTHLYGLTDTNHYTYEDFVNNVLPGLDNITRHAFYNCTKHLDRAFKNCALKNRLDSATQAGVYTELRKFRNDIQPRLLEAANSASTSVPATKMTANANIEDCDWKDCSDIVSDLPPDVLNTLVAKLNNSESGEILIEDGVAYRIIDCGNTASIQRTYEVDKVRAALGKATAHPVASAIPAVSRKTKQVVFLKDNNDFKGIFEAGMFYDIVKSENGYTTLCGADGENHTLNNKRLEFVDVYAAAPEAEVVA